MASKVKLKTEPTENQLAQRSSSSQSLTSSARYRSINMDSEAPTRENSEAQTTAVSSNDPGNVATNSRSGYARLQEDADSSLAVEEGQRLKLWQAYVHVVKGNVGPGCLSMPYTFSEGGLIPSICIWALFSPACIYSMQLLVYSKHKMISSGGARAAEASSINFEQVGKYALGSFGGHLIELFVCLTQLGVCSIFFDFCSTNLHALLPTLSPEIFITLLVPVVVLMVMIRSARGLVGFSSIASVLIVGVLLAVWGFVAPHLGGDLRDKPLRLVGRRDRIPLVFSNLAFAFEGIGLVLPIESAMEEANRHAFPQALGAGMSTVAVILLLNGLLCFIALGDVESASITAALAGQGLDPRVVAALNCLATLAVLLTYPLQFLPPVQILEHVTGLDRVFRGEVKLSRSTRSQGMSSTVRSSINQPSSVDEESRGLISPEAQQVVDSVDASVSHVVITSSVMEDGVEDRLEPTTLPITDPEPPIFAELSRCLSLWGTHHGWVPFRALLVVLTALVAHTVPNLGTLIALIGSVASTTLGLLLPPLIHYKLCGSSYKWYHYVLHGFLIVLGLVGGTLGFYEACSDLMAEEYNPPTISPTES